MPIPAGEKRFLFVLVLVALTVGSFARFADLNRKMFWGDEAVTALRVSGHQTSDVLALFDGKVHPVADMRRLTDRDPATNVVTVLQSSERDDPHHAPLFYLLDRLALDAFGTNEPSTYRFPSALFGALAIGFAFLLGRELYRSSLGGGMLAALVALSPLHVLYSRQAREYALFTSLVFASSYIFLLASRRRNVGLWLAYAFAVALGIYTDPIFGLVVASHAVCAVALLRRDLRVLGAYALATAAGLATFAPWGLNALHAKGDIEGQLIWGRSQFPPAFLAEKWAFNIGAVFFDAEFANLRLAVVAAIVVAIVLASAVAFVRNADPRARAFALPLTIVPITAYVVLDLIIGAHFSTIPRYLTAGWIGLELVVATALFSGVTARSRTALGAFVFLIAAGIFSAYVDHGAVNWWDNNSQVAYQAVAQTIDLTPTPLIVDGDLHEVAEIIARYLRPDAKLLLFEGPTVPPLPPDTQRAFFVVPGQYVLATIAARDGKRYALENISPADTNAITTFHRQLSRARGTPASAGGGMGDSERPDNALWLLTRR